MKLGIVSLIAVFSFAVAEEAVAERSFLRSAVPTKSALVSVAYYDCSVPCGEDGCCASGDICESDGGCGVPGTCYCGDSTYCEAGYGCIGGDQCSTAATCNPIPTNRPTPYPSSGSISFPTAPPVPTNRPVASPTTPPAPTLAPWWYPTYSPVSQPSGDSSSGGNSGGCFSGSEMVTLESGQDVYISEVSVGDRVLTWSGSQFTFSDVIFLPHVKNREETTFIQVSLESGRLIRMTESHLLPVGSCSAEVSMSLEFAENLVSGLCVRSISGLEKILTTERVRANGVYTLVTNEEFIVVNGVVASPFSVNHYLVNKFYHLHRTVYALFPSMLSDPTYKWGEITNGLGAVALCMVTWNK